MDLIAALRTAKDAARQAGKILLDDFHRPGGPRGSGDKADADIEAEWLIRKVLLDAFSGYGYLGEETGGQEPSPGAPVWLVDPNDGTRDYLRGHRGSSVSIALLVNRRPALGVVLAFGYPDDTGTLYAFGEGCGPLTVNEEPVTSSLPLSLAGSDVVLVASDAERDPEGMRACTHPSRFRFVPSIAHRLAAVAAGEAAAQVSLRAPSAWDFGAGHALLRSVGGIVADETGREVTYTESGECRTARAFGGAPAVVADLAARDWIRVGLRRPHTYGGLVVLEAGHAVREAGVLSRAQGCLLGQLAGDSLGSLVEFEPSVEIARRHGDGPKHLQDGGTWNTIAGQPTDDSEMALALARSLVFEGRFDRNAVLQAYRRWAGSAPFDMGKTVRAALSSKTTPESRANGSLMRASPVGIFGHRLSEAEVARIAQEDSALTHPNPVCCDSVAAYVVAIAHAVGRGGTAREAWEAALAWARRSVAAVSVTEALEIAATEPPVCDGATQGYVLIALQNAFYELLHASSLEEGVVRTVRRGGDTDTNAAIAGALLGAVHGRKAVPLQWRNMVLSCRPKGTGVAHPRPITCWPVDALQIAERLLLAGTGAAVFA